MKINTISTYVLVYLLTNGHWNLMVPVKADGGSTGGSDAGSTAGSKAGSTAGSDAGSTAGSKAGSKAGSDVGDVSSLEADGSSASTDATSTGGASGSSSESAPANEGSTSGDANANAYLSSGTVATPASEADGGSSASADSSDGSSGQSASANVTVLLNGLYPDHHTSGWHADMVGPDPNLKAKREEAKRLAAEARKAADELLKAAEKLNKEADQLLEEIEKPYLIEELDAKIDATASKVNVEMKRADDMAHQLDMTYYSGFPSGHHGRVQGALDQIAEYKRDTTYYNGFPVGWHFENPELFTNAENYRKNKYDEDRDAKQKQIVDKEKEIRNKEDQIARKYTEMVVKKEAVEDKFEELSAKRQEAHDMRELIKELQNDLIKLEQEASTLSTEHGSLNRDYIKLDHENKKLGEEKTKLECEHKVFEEELMNLLKSYYNLSEKTSYLSRRDTEHEIYGDPRDTFSAYTDDSIQLVAKEHKVIGDINPADNFSEFPAVIATSAYKAATLSDSSSAEGQAKVEVKEAAPAGEGSVAAPAVPGAGSTEAKPVEDSAEAKAPEVGAKVEESAPVSTAAPAHTAGHVAVPEAKTEAQAAPTHTAGHAAVPEAKAEAQAAPTGVKFYKTGSDGSMVEMVENTDFEKKKVVGDDKYEFKQHVVCEKVMFGDKEVWKKGDQNVSAANSVTYRVSLKAIVVRDRDKSVSYKMNTSNNEWVYVTTITRTQRTRQSSDSSTTSTRTGLASPGLARGIAGGSTTNLASSSAKFGGSVSNLDTASTTGSDEGKSSGSTDVANLKEVEDDTSGSASAGSGGSGSSTLRGAGAGKTTH